MLNVKSKMLTIPSNGCFDKDPDLLDGVLVSALLESTPLDLENDEAVLNSYNGKIKLNKTFQMGQKLSIVWKTFLLSLLFFAPVVAKAQLGILVNKYYITGSLSVGQGSRDKFADSSAWMQIGGDTTNKGFIIPRILGGLSTVKRGVFYYSLEDSTLRHKDGTAEVKYLTDKDSNYIKNLVGEDVSPTLQEVIDNGDTSNKDFVIKRSSYTGTTMIMDGISSFSPPNPTRVSLYVTSKTSHPPGPGGGNGLGIQSVAEYTDTIGYLSTTTLYGIQAIAIASSGTSNGGLYDHDFTEGSAGSNMTGLTGSATTRDSAYSTSAAGVVGQVTALQQSHIRFAANFVSVGHKRGTGTVIDSFAGIYLQQRGNFLGGGTLGSNYGIFMDSMVGGNTNYGIWFKNNPSHGSIATAPGQDFSIKTGTSAATKIHGPLYGYDTTNLQSKIYLQTADTESVAGENTTIGLNSYYTQTSGRRILNQSYGTFAPTSGSGSFAAYFVGSTINQTGGANGVTASFVANPTITAAADYRAFRASNATGVAFYNENAGARNVFLGETQIGSATDLGAYNLQVTGTSFFTGTTTLNSNAVLNANVTLSSIPAYSTGGYSTLVKNTATNNVETVTVPTLASGTYSPTKTNVANISGSIVYSASYSRVGNVVTVFGKADIQPTAAANTQTELAIALPIASSFTAEEDLGGTGASDASAGYSIRIKADATNDRASFVFKSETTSMTSYSFQFSYVIK